MKPQEKDLAFPHNGEKPTEEGDILPIQYRYLDCIAVGKTVPGALHHLAVDKGEIYHWRQGKRFRQLEAIARGEAAREAHLEARHTLDMGAPRAAEIATEVMEDAELDRDKLVAARLVLEGSGIVQKGAQIAIQVNNGNRSWGAWGSDDSGQASPGEPTTTVVREVTKGDKEPPPSAKAEEKEV